MAATTFEQLQQRLADFRHRYPELAKPVNPAERLIEADAMLITYGDQIGEPRRPKWREIVAPLDAFEAGGYNSSRLLSTDSQWRLAG